MSVRYVRSLRHLRAELNVELRNTDPSPRYTDEEVDNAIRRAVQTLEPYFWVESSDSSKTVVNSTYDYAYVGHKEIYRVDIVQGSAAPMTIYDWGETYNPATNTVSLHMYKNQPSGATIVVHFEDHPTLPPSDLVVSAATIDLTDNFFDVTKSTAAYDWPSTGFLEVTTADTVLGKEYMSYTLDLGGATNPATDARFTVVREQYGTTSDVTFSLDDIVSYVLLSESAAFFEGVKDLSLVYLNRMRMIDAPSADTSGNVTVMREIGEAFQNWIRMNRMRHKRNPRDVRNTTRPMVRRWWRRN